MKSDFIYPTQKITLIFSNLFSLALKFFNKILSVVCCALFRNIVGLCLFKNPANSKHHHLSFKLVFSSFQIFGKHPPCFFVFSFHHPLPPCHVVRAVETLVTPSLGKTTCNLLINLSVAVHSFFLSDNIAIY